MMDRLLSTLLQLCKAVSVALAAVGKTLDMKPPKRVRRRLAWGRYGAAALMTLLRPRPPTPRNVEGMGWAWFCLPPKSALIFTFPPTIGVWLPAPAVAVLPGVPPGPGPDELKWNTASRIELMSKTSTRMLIIFALRDWR